VEEGAIMSEKQRAAYEDLSGVDGDGLGEGEVGFECEGLWWKEGERGRATVAEFYEDLSGVDGDGLGEGEVGFEGEERFWEEGYQAASIQRRAGNSGRSQLQIPV
jgi:hypothetical protein